MKPLNAIVELNADEVEEVSGGVPLILAVPVVVGLTLLLSGSTEQ